MCGRFSLKTSPDTLERIFGHPLPPGYKPRYNIAPGQEVLAIVVGQGTERPALLRWGLVPFWAKDPSIGNRLVNARVEGIADKPVFRDAFRHRRCIILADGFYEWQRRSGGRYPMWVSKPSGEPFALAGLWERWNRGETPIESCTILTMSSNAFMGTIHDRMPVLLEEKARREWLSEGIGEERLFGLVASCGGIRLQAHEVSRIVNNSANDEPACIEPVDADPALALFPDSA